MMPFFLSFHLDITDCLLEIWRYMHKNKDNCGRSRTLKIGLDECGHVIVQYGHIKSSIIDILGYCISISSKSISKYKNILAEED